MKITFVGTASGRTSAERAASCLYVETGSGNFLIDAGDGAARGIVRLGIPFHAVGALFISHMHPDHASGLIPLLQQFYLAERTDPLTVYLPASAAGKMEDLLSLFWMDSRKWPFDLRLTRWETGVPVRTGNFEIRPLENGHLPARGESFSFILREGGKQCVYTADVDGLGHLRKAGGRTDLLISECTHIGVDDILRFSVENSISQIVVTHIPDGTDTDSEMKKIPDGGVTLRFARDGDTVTV